MRPGRKDLRVLRPNAILDERPAERRWLAPGLAFVAGLALGATLALLWARSEFAELRVEMRRGPDITRTR